MNFFLRLIIVTAILTVSAHAQLTLTGAGKGAPGGGGGGCSQATALIARMDGTQSARNADITTLICGLVTDGVYSSLDGLYVFNTSDTTNATLNWAQNAFNLTWTILANCTFTANSGIKGDGATCFASTGYTPSSSGGNFAQNSASIGGCVVASRTASDTSTLIGTTNSAGGTYSYIQPLNGGNVSYDLQGGTFPSFANSDAQGSWIVTRTGSGSLTLYKNGSSVATPSDTSSSLTNEPIGILALLGTIPSSFSTDKIGYAFFGAGLTGTQVGNIRSRLNTYVGSGC